MSTLEFVQGIYLVITTELDKEKAYKISNILLREKLIACVTFKNIESYFWWEGEINHSQEVQLIMKCREKNLNRVCRKILENHSYDVPEILTLPVSASRNYYQWLSSL